jgi:hypothetical protein
MTVTSVLGTELQVTRYYGDGSYDCPHCGYAIRADEGLGPCHNPWCVANPLMPVDRAHKLLAERAERTRQEAERKRNHELSMRRIEEWKRVEHETRTAKLLAAREAGYCIACLVHSSYRKQVRHRGVCPRER